MIRRLWPAVILALLVPACSRNASHPSVASVPAEILGRWQEQEKPVVLLDVRPDSLFDSGRISGSIRAGGRRVSELRDVLPRDPATPIVVIDVPGTPGPGDLAAALSDFGFPRVYRLDGGMAAWEAGGYPVIGFRSVPSSPR